MDRKETGALKADQYKEYKKRFQRAMKAECYLECVFIDYAMMEDRLLSILHHLNIADRERKQGRGWARSPKAKRDGYKSALRSMLKLRKDGTLPNIDRISTKIDVLRTLATLEESVDCHNDFENWLRTEVRSKLVACGVPGLCDDISRWIQQRNDLTHALFGMRSRSYNVDTFRAFAKDGMYMATQLDNVSGCIARLMSKYEKDRSLQTAKHSRHR